VIKRKSASVQHDDMHEKVTAWSLFRIKNRRRKLVNDSKEF